MNQVSSVPQARRETLRGVLPQVVELLQKRRASEIDDTVIDDLVSLYWLEWVGGSLQLTTTGKNVSRQLLE
ncbi:hypothetical protein G7048_16655 [Diaphorobacter sp. HDW4B]|uniref:hypothetical protein n=1 Tax=Diaphorobacter sp. HDW4B TaxID=2714925 RepID=UPI00140B96E3|nr:hypothetical protein [Diaphorobacter sp. HDW4B]QIL71845.1 hypothetical protein G7048_16655 [Diaphorobacter sp. HDW4B]